MLIHDHIVHVFFLYVHVDSCHAHDHWNSDVNSNNIHSHIFLEIVNFWIYVKNFSAQQILSRMWRVWCEKMLMFIFCFRKVKLIESDVILQKNPYTLFKRWSDCDIFNTHHCHKRLYCTLIWWRCNSHYFIDVQIFQLEMENARNVLDHCHCALF